MADGQDNEKYLLPVDDGLYMSEWGYWAKDKLDILARYIKSSTKAMSSPKMHWRKRYYIDLLAGPGKSYVRKQRSNIFLGSPLIALADETGFTDYIFVEENSKSVDALIKRCTVATIRPGINVKVLAGDCNVLIDGIVDEINSVDRPPFSKTDWNSLGLAFLDPEGLELNWDTVLKLASLKRVDLLVNFSTGGLKRTVLPALRAEPGEAQADRFFGTLDWRNIPLKSTGRMPVNEWIEFYQERLTERTDPPYQWGTSKSVKNSKGVEMYRLIFASKSELGIALWEDAWSKGPTQPTLL